MGANSTYRSVTLSTGESMEKSDTIDQISEPKPRAAERILGVARKLFYLEGIRAVGVDEIVRQAGVTKPSLYRSFPSKDELAASYLREYEKAFWQRFDAAVEAHPGDPRRQIIAFLSGVGERAAMAKEMGAANPDTLGDGLLLLIEGAYISGQLFGPGGPAAAVARNADLLIEASLGSAGDSLLFSAERQSRTEADASGKK